MSNDRIFKQPENSPIMPKQTPLYDWDQDPEIRRSGDVSAKAPDVFVVPTLDDINRVPDLPSGFEDEPTDAWKDLGGQTSEPGLDSKIAMYSAGLGSKAMRAEVEAHFAQTERARQYEINKAGAEAVRQAGLPNRPLTIEERARIRLAEQRRQQRS